MGWGGGECCVWAVEAFGRLKGAGAAAVLLVLNEDCMGQGSVAAGGQHGDAMHRTQYEFVSGTISAGSGSERLGRSMMAAGEDACYSETGGAS